MRFTSISRVALAALLAAAAAALAPGLAHAATTPKSVKPASLNTGVFDVETNLAFDQGAAAGTGIALTSTGEILTNNHVIRGAQTVTVVDPSTGKRYPGTVVGYSVTSDIAVIQIKAKNLKTVALGNSSTVKVGQKVTAVGNAGGVGGTPSHAPGSVTATSATITASDESGLSEQLVGLIKTNANLQPGDSGGPLLNAAGKVVGIDTAASQGFAFQNGTEGYAIPINRAVTLAKQIVAGKASLTVHIGSTPLLGVSVSTQPQETPGALVQSTVTGYPADQAGIVAGDTITQLDGKPVNTYADLSSLLLLHNAGDVVSVTWVDLNGVTQTANVTTVSGPPQ
jgi:S1-C subfamily serine protease